MEGSFRLSSIIDQWEILTKKTCLITRGCPKIATSNVEHDEKPLGFRIIFVETLVCIHEMHKNTFIIKKTHCKKNNDTCTTGGSQPLSNQRKNKPMSNQRGYTWFQLDTYVHAIYLSSVESLPTPTLDDVIPMTHDSVLIGFKPPTGGWSTILIGDRDGDARGAYLLISAYQPELMIPHLLLTACCEHL